MEGTSPRGDLREELSDCYMRNVIIERLLYAPYVRKKQQQARRNMQQQIRSVSIDEVKRFSQENPDGLIVGVLPSEFHALQHVPGSVGICVFETAFQEKMANAAPDKTTPLLVYGAGDSLDSEVAAEKLRREGYADVRVFPGGLDAWRKAGLPLEGERADRPLPEEVPLPRFPRYVLLPEKSAVLWTGRNNAHSHRGTLSLKGGELEFDGGPQGEGRGILTFDMHSIDCLDLQGDVLLPVLLAHLKSVDFFDVALHPQAHLRILSLRPLPEGTVTGRTHRLRGALGVLGMERILECDVELRNLDGDELGMSCQLVWDRTLWGVRYGSARFFRFMGMHSVDDNVGLTVALVFRNDQ